jgi:hypothetical protein
MNPHLMSSNMPNSLLVLMLVSLGLGGAWPTREWVLRRFRSERAGRVAWRFWRSIQLALLLTATVLLFWHLFGPKAQTEA